MFKSKNPQEKGNSQKGTQKHNAIDLDIHNISLEYLGNNTGNIKHGDCKALLSELENLKRKYLSLEVLYEKEKEKNKLISNLENDTWILRIENQQLKEKINELEKQNGCIKKGGRKEYENVEVIKRVYSMYLNGQSLRNICDTLNLEQIKTKSGRTWAKSSLRLILTNSTYVKKGIIDENTFISVAARLRR